MIRVATLDDFEPILDLCEKFWLETMYKEEFNREYVWFVVEESYKAGLLAVLDVNGIEGFVAGSKGPLLANPEVMQGTELAWWVNPEFRKGRNGIELMLFIEDLARNEGIKYWNMVSMESSSPDTANRIYERLGYNRNENVYTKVI